MRVEAQTARLRHSRLPPCCVRWAGSPQQVGFPLAPPLPAALNYIVQLSREQRHLKNLTKRETDTPVNTRLVNTRLRAPETARRDDDNEQTI